MSLSTGPGGLPFSSLSGWKLPLHYRPPAAVGV